MFKRRNFIMNKSGNQNRSVRNTKKRLKEALLSLLQDKPINEISVTELSELADVNRGTFYFHYADVYDMLYKTEDEFFREFEKILDFDENDKTNIYQYLLKIFSFLGDNHDMCSVFFSENNDMKFFNKTKLLVNKHLCSLWKYADTHFNQTKMEMYNSFIVNGCAGIMQRWLDDGLQESPEEIAALVSSIISSILNTDHCLL